MSQSLPNAKRRMTDELTIPSANTNANTAGPQNCIRARVSHPNHHIHFARKRKREQDLPARPSTTPICAIHALIFRDEEANGSNPFTPTILANKHGGYMSSILASRATANTMPTRMPTRAGS